MEILIVIVLFGMLAGIIMQSYTTISQVSFRIHQEKEIAKEALMLSQILENLAQTTTIDYSKYESSELSSTKWIVEKLHLKGNDKTQYEIFSTESCITNKALHDRAPQAPKEEKSDTTPDPTCQLQLISTKEGKSQTSTLLDGKNFKLSKISFKIMPFMGKEKRQEYLQNPNSETTPINTPDDAKPAFWLLGNLYSNYYNPHKRSNNIILPLQLFFSLQGETPSLYSQLESTNE